ncbi:unnamed protein product [Bursaphelenchus xylophilus]|uniref:ATP-dependent DNA helicase n=1 Tax=Bursaphelenchus xylophilus TaxID=6326 RepID=A0A1I7SMP5_BURXY|nr:unnamed protein product [Bursaphelenchus xylophilus]CAG9130307.1 unnamed protein product [Bursaphelenchus xylophilus]
MGSNNALLSVYSEIKDVNNRLSVIEKERSELKEKLHVLTAKANELEARWNNDDEHSTWNDNSFPWDSKVDGSLKKVFGLTSFRPLQRAAINLALSGEDSLIIMSTGAGKSLCYQLPAVVNEGSFNLDGITLVISPLISLVNDQLMHLQTLHINAMAFNAATSKEDASNILKSICERKSALRMLYVTPEKLAKSKRFMNKLEKCYEMGLLKLIAIDEVHCCSQWGHDFRPDYKFLGILKRQFPKTPLMGLTATATLDVITDVKKILDVRGCVTLKTAFNRKNLYYQVIQKPDSNDATNKLISALLKGDFKHQSGIIYCLSRKDCEELTQDLKKEGVNCAFYHGDLESGARVRVHERWNSGQYQVIIATLAFGMGIDKANVRFVIHHSIAKSMENYYQESGRAGRDDNPSKCIVLFRMADVFRQSTMNYTDSVSHLYGMMKYCIQNYECRRVAMSEYFGETYEKNWCEKGCDFCERDNVNVEEIDITTQARLVMEILQDKQLGKDRITGNKLLELLYKKLEDSRDFLEKIVGTLLLEGYLKEEFHFTPYSVISYIVWGSRSVQGRVTILSDLNSMVGKSSAKRRKNNNSNK